MNKKWKKICALVMAFCMVLQTGQIYNSYAADVQTVKETREESDNLALGKNTEVSGVEAGKEYLSKDKAVDGDKTGNSRWASEFAEEQWIYVDLGSKMPVNHVKLFWENPAVKYKIQLSNSAATGSWTTVYEADGNTEKLSDITFEAYEARYIRVLCEERTLVGGVKYGYSLYEMEVYYENQYVNIALGKTTESSGVEVGKPQYISDNAVDGKREGDSRWSSVHAEEQWIMVDFGAPRTFDKVKLFWEAAMAKGYKLQISDNKTDWTDVFTTADNTSLDNTITLSEPQTAQYVRLFCTERTVVAGGKWGYSLYEFEIYGEFRGGDQILPPNELPEEGMSRRMEAEAGDLVPSSSGEVAQIVNKSGASGGKSLEFFQDGKGVEYRNVPQSNRVKICHASLNTSGVVDVYVDNVKLASIMFEATGSWGPPFDRVSYVDVNVPEGATVKLVAPGSPVNLDWVEFAEETGVYPKGCLPAIEAELNGAEIVEDRVSYTGQAVELKEQNDALTFTIPENFFTEEMNVVNFRYLTAQETTATVQINDKAPVEIRFYPTFGGMYEVYRYLAEDLLKAGDKITLSLTGETPLYIDTAAFSYAKTSKLDPIQIEEVPEKGDRKTVSLNGTWECVKTADNAQRIPELYDNRIPVPGLWDLAETDLGSFENSSLWYRRAVHFGEIPEKVTLRIGKAEYGRYIYVNGQFVDYYTYNFTASETDITKYLKANADNIIEIRVQNRNQQHSDPQSTAHTGFDNERKNYYPGIYDDVSLILNADPEVASLQNAPDLENGTVHFRAFLQNQSDKAVTTPVTVEVYELGLVKENGEPEKPELVGKATIADVTVEPGTEKTVDFENVKINDFNETKYWSPENPYLYRVVVKTSGDTYTDRFAMRTFKFDSETKKAMLNGEPRFIRGTNVCLYRFFDDPQRKALPWNEEWVCDLYEEFQSVNWEAFRSHVCFLPERWYELADEYGFLIFDEYPFWQNCKGCGCTSEDILPEVKNWMTERGMHASVIQWDIQNESFTGIMRPVIQALRSYDIQNRSWNNGWVAADEPTDMAEGHPYLYDRSDFQLSYMNVMNRQPWTLPMSNQNVALILNETGWNWINRDGSPTVLGAPWFDTNMRNATPKEKLEYYAESQAQLAEFWRSGGYITGNLQFTGLSYSIPGGQTSDILNPDVSKPEINTYLKGMLRSAYAPLGILIDNFDEECWNGEEKTFPITLMNGLNKEYEKVPVDVILYDGEKEVSKQTFVYDVDKMGTASKDYTLRIPKETETEQLRLVAKYTDEDGEEIFSQRKLKVNYSEHGIATGKTATSSSTRQEYAYIKNYAQNVTDGSNLTYWQANGDDTQPWVMLDLGEKMSLSKVKLNWTNQFAKAYELEVSDDGEEFVAVYSGGASAAGEQLIDVQAEGRYIRVRITEKNGSAPGLYEFDVWGNAEQIETDKEMLAALIDYAQSQKENVDYANVIPVVKAAFEKALAEAAAVNEDKAATQEEVDAAYEKLLEMVHMLDFIKGDTTNLKALVDIVKGMNKDLFTEDSWAAVEDALAKAEAVLADENAMQEEIDAAAKELQAAKDALVRIPVDKAKLQKLVDKAKKYEDAIKDYTPATADIFKSALANAREVLTNEDVTQKDIDDAYAMLQNAIFGLRLTPDKDKLEDLIKDAEKVDTANYTAESAAAFTAALDNAKAVFTDENATAEDVKAAEKALKAAQKNLVAKADADKKDNDKKDNDKKGNDKVASADGNNKTADKAAKTGDVSHTAVMMAALAAGIAAVLSFRRKVRR